MLGAQPHALPPTSLITELNTTHLPPCRHQDAIAWQHTALQAFQGQLPPGAAKILNATRRMATYMRRGGGRKRLQETEQWLRRLLQLLQEHAAMQEEDAQEQGARGAAARGASLLRQECALVQAQIADCLALQVCGAGPETSVP